MKQVLLTIKENKCIARDVYLMVLEGDVSAISAPGQFINIQLDGLYLRRPISVCDLTEDTVTIIYKLVGKGTEMMSEMKPGKALDVLTGLGNGYDLTLIPEDATVLLIGGGVGVPPMYLLAKKLLASGRKVTVVLGFNSECDVFFEEEFKALGVDIRVATADGTYGTKGFVTDVLPESYDYFCTCGPTPMLKAVYVATESDGQMSFEERMCSGFGACMGCTCKTITGYKRICKDGPVMRKGEILW
ncbi:MAG: dihydroorotate dehydrogenase electron transfer subunit [Clostridiales bacterium]|nr:dihydroorotate dehydrogenase electron transfer subunit [Candidatus Crickella merdequi]